MLGYAWPRLHAALNDLPAALLVVAVLFDLVALGTRRASFRQVGFWTLVVGVLGAGAAVLSGREARDDIAHGTAVHRVMETHETLAYVTLGIFALLAVWRIVRETRMGGAERALSLVLSLGGLGVLVATAVYGGRLVFDHAAGIPTAVLQSEMQERTEAHDHGAGGEAGPDAAAPAAATIDSAAYTDSAAVPVPAAGHVDPPGTPPHTHRKAASHTHAPGTPAHQD